MANADRNPTPDPAEHGAFFPSPYSLSQYTSSKTDFQGVEFDQPYTGGRWRVLMIATDERYLLMEDGKFFSTGNHPVEMLLPMHHLDQAGFEIDVATLSGNPAKLEVWALPHEDRAVLSTYEKYLPRLKQPRKLSDVIAENLGADSPYLGLFIPGGHGAMVGIPHSREVGRVLNWALENDRLIVTLCHGPAALLAAAVDVPPAQYPFRGYQLCVFPDALDRQNPAIGYMPGPMPWYVAEKLAALGVEILNDGITGQCHQDRKLLTGDSPLASNKLGKLAAQALLAAAAT